MTWRHGLYARLEARDVRDAVRDSFLRAHALGVTDALALLYVPSMERAEDAAMRSCRFLLASDAVENWAVWRTEDELGRECLGVLLEGVK